MSIHFQSRRCPSNINSLVRACLLLGFVALALVLTARPSAAINFPVNIKLSYNADTMCVGGKTQTLTATVTKQSDNSAVQGASVSFSGGSLNPSAGTTGANGQVTTTLTSPASAGTATVTASTSWVADPKNNVAASSASDPKTFNFIGGAITGDTDMRYRCLGDATPPKTFSAVGGQPNGTKYTWSTSSAGQGQVGFYNNYTSVTTWSGVGSTYAQIGVKGTAASSAANDVTVKATYSLNGVECSSPDLNLTVRQGKTVVKIRDVGLATITYYPSDGPGSPWYGFGSSDPTTRQRIQWGLTDQFNTPLPMESVNEVWTPLVSLIPNQALPGSGLANGVAWSTTTSGYFNDLDYFNFTGLGRDAAGNDLLNLSRPGEADCLTTTHEFFSGSATTGAGCTLNSFNTTWSNRQVKGQ